MSDQAVLNGFYVGLKPLAAHKAFQNGLAPAACRARGYALLPRKLQCRWVGPWRSLVARFLGVEEVPSSNLGGPTNLLNNLVTFLSARGSI